MTDIASHILGFASSFGKSGTWQVYDKWKLNVHQNLEYKIKNKWQQVIFKNLKVSIITLTGRDDDVLYYEGSASVSSINISISFTLLNKSLGFVTYQLSFLHALVGFVQLRKALIQKQYCIYWYLIVWILRLLWHENEFCYTWRKNNGMSSFNFCNCSLSVSDILDICLGGGYSIIKQIWH